MAEAARAGKEQRSYAERESEVQRALELSKYQLFDVSPFNVFNKEFLDTLTAEEHEFLAKLKAARCIEDLPVDKHRLFELCERARDFDSARCRLAEHDSADEPGPDALFAEDNELSK